MGFVLSNLNPDKLNVGDCAIRAIAEATQKPWRDVYMAVALQGLRLSDMPSSNRVWGNYLDEQGYKLNIVPDSCPTCYTIKDFAREYCEGRYVVGTGSHVIAVVNGDYYDTWDSGEERPMYFWKKVEA